MKHSRFILIGTSLLSIILASGCQSYQNVSADRDAAVRAGDYKAAAEQANRDAEKNKDNKDTILYRLEQGSILRAASIAEAPQPTSQPTLEIAPQTGVTNQQTDTNMLEIGTILSPSQQLLVNSIEAFDAAEERINRYEEEAKVKLASETGALLTNQANLPYRGFSYDKVMLNTYKTLNYLQMGDIDKARVELNRAYQRQSDAVAENAKRIEEAKEIAAKAKAGELKDDKGKGAAYDVDQARTDSTTGNMINQYEAELDEAIRAYGDYVNPFSVFLDGLYFLYHGVDGSDFERSRMSLERVVNMAPSNPYVAVDLDAAAKGQTPNNVTYIFFETGSAPHRDQVRIDIPVGIATNRLSYVGAAFPKLKFNDNYVRTLTVNDGVQDYQTSLLCSMDSVIAQDFKNEWPSILTKTMVSTATKALIDAAIQNEAKRHGWQAQLAAKLVTGITQASVNIADTRTWRSLPKEFQYARVETPQDGIITISDGIRHSSFTVDPNRVNVIYVKSPSPEAPLLATAFELK